MKKKSIFRWVVFRWEGVALICGYLIAQDNLAWSLAGVAIAALFVSVDYTMTARGRTVVEKVRMGKLRRHPTHQDGDFWSVECECGYETFRYASADSAKARWELHVCIGPREEKGMNS